MDNEFDMESDWITELGKARSDEYTEKILAFVQELEKSAPEPFLPLLTDLALARTLIVHLVIRYGPERGMAEARDAFESTLEQIHNHARFATFREFGQHGRYAASSPSPFLL
jgi:hypothetical protein